MRVRLAATPGAALLVLLAMGGCAPEEPAMNADSVDTARASVAAMAAAHPEDAGRLDAALAAIGRELNDDPDTIGDLRHGDQRSRAIRTRIHGKTMAQIIESGERAAQNAAAEAVQDVAAGPAASPTTGAAKVYTAMPSWTEDQYKEMSSRVQVGDLTVSPGPGGKPVVVVNVRNGTPEHIVGADIHYWVQHDANFKSGGHLYCDSKAGLAPGAFGQLTCRADAKQFESQLTQDRRAGTLYVAFQSSAGYMGAQPIHAARSSR